MIKQLNLKNFTCFAKANLNFAAGLNVIIGENATGKTNLLKVAYLFSKTLHNNKTLAEKDSNESLERQFSTQINSLFKADKLGHLTTQGSDGKTLVECSLTESCKTLKQKNTLWQLSFSNRSKENLSLQTTLEQNHPTNLKSKAVFIPSKEILSFFEGFLALYVKHNLPFDETFYDLCLHLATPKLKKYPAFIQQALQTLVDDIGGTLILEGGKFYLQNQGKREEISLVAEGIRKLATLIHIIENGSLEQNDTLFWDEPESNLNPKLIKDVASALMFLANNDIQVIIATHSLFLLRELEILSSQKEYQKIPQRYFALEKTATGVQVHQGDSVDDIEPLIMLDEDLQQSERFMAMEES